MASGTEHAPAESSEQVYSTILRDQSIILERGARVMRYTLSIEHHEEKKTDRFFVLSDVPGPGNAYESIQEVFFVCEKPQGTVTTREEMNTIFVDWVTSKTIKTGI